jgi:uncharacterized membrane protein
MNNYTFSKTAVKQISETVNWVEKHRTDLVGKGTKKPNLKTSSNGGSPFYWCKITKKIILTNMKAIYIHPAMIMKL